MQLTKKTLIFSVLVILLSIPIVYLLSNYMIVGNFARLESERVNLSAEQVKNNLLGDLEVWSNTARDWAIWDDAYDYINGDNPQFEKSNLNSTAFIQNQVNYMVYFDKSGKVVSATGFDLKTKEPKTIPDDLYKTINNLKLTNLNDINESKMGLVALNQGLAFIAANPVMDSELKVGSVGRDTCMG